MDSPNNDPGVALPPFLASLKDQLQPIMDQMASQSQKAGWRDMLTDRQRVMLDCAIAIDKNYQAAGWVGQGQAALIRVMADILDSLV